MNQTKEMTSKAYFGVSDVAIVILSMDEQERFYFEYVTPSFTQFFNCNLNNLIGSNIYDVFPALPKDLYQMARNVVLNGVREEFFVSDEILQEPIRITCYQSEPGYCTCFLERYSDYEREYEHRLRTLAFQSLVEEASNVVIWYNKNTKKVRFHKIDTLFWNLQSLETDFTKQLVSQEIVHPQCKNRFLKMVKLAYNKTQASGDIRLKNNKGSYLYVNVLLYYHEDPNPDFSTLMIMIKNIQKEKLEAARLKRLAEKDRLTDLYNRGAIEDLITKHLSRSRNKNKNTGVIIIDLDNFRDANNYYGHLYGDKVLIEYTRELPKIFPEGTLIGRTGGDEFLVFLPDVKNNQEVVEHMKQILRINHKLLVLPHKEFQISTSIGASVASPCEASFSDMFMNADSALYSVKNKGGNSFALYDESAQSNRLAEINEKVLEAVKPYNPIFLSPYSKLPPQIRKKVYRLLVKMASVFSFQRVYIANQNNYLELIWHEPNISNLVLNFDSIGIHDVLKRQKVIFYPDLKANYPAIDEIAKAQGIKFAVLIALFDQDNYLGYLGCSDCRIEREFTEIDLRCLKHFSDCIAILFQNED
ncbi:MAG: diguanylate cyclase [Bacilli bacterium]